MQGRAVGLNSEYPLIAYCRVDLERCRPVYAASSADALADRGALLYQIIIHIPVNYEHRYSVGALDLWLILFSAIGMAYFIGNNRSGRSPLKLIAVLMLMFAAIGYGEWHRINSPPLMPNILAVPHDVIWKREGNDLATLRGAAIVSEGDGRYRLDGDYPALYLPVRNVKELYYGAKLCIELHPLSAGCGR